MATPGAPTNLEARPGPHPQTLRINATAVTADPVVTSYSFYIEGVTGVGKTSFKHKMIATRPYVTTPILFHAERYFVTITAENSEAEGNAATEVEVVMSG